MRIHEYDLTPIRLEVLESELAKLGYSLNKPRDLAQAVQRLSDYYIQSPLAHSPWRETWAQAAYICYFHPLNYIRCLSVFKEAKRLGFLEGIDSYVDYGSGLGAAALALTTVAGHATHSLKSGYHIEDEPKAAFIQNNLRAALSAHANYRHTVIQKDHWDLKPERGTALICAYALTELENLPDKWLDFNFIALIEPATRQDGRRLLAIRQQLIDQGYHIAAPCTHQGVCPLLSQSQTDWCHHRIAIPPLPWLKEIEKYLPMKNETLTYSYLLAQRTPLAGAESGLVRVIGDELPEKGKTKQSICRNSDREFIAWFPQRLKETIQIERGVRFRFKTEPVKKGSELRLNSLDDLELQS